MARYKVYAMANVLVELGVAASLKAARDLRRQRAEELFPTGQIHLCHQCEEKLGDHLTVETVVTDLVER